MRHYENACPRRGTSRSYWIRLLRLFEQPFRKCASYSGDDFLLAFRGEGALRGVVRGIGARDETRRYMCYQASGVPEWYKETWSVCTAPDNNEISEFERNVDMGPGGQLDAVCEIDADGDVFVRGWIVSVPKL